MYLTNVKKVSVRDISDYSWARLAQFQNADFTASKISSLHGLAKNHAENVKSQAEQIKQCLAQAREYFRAAEVVTLATRPVLLYYGLMSLALAEVLFKQTGDSRLKKLREQHPAHGLALKLTADPKTTDSLATAAEKLVAKPQFNGNGNAFGTFEIWRRSAREYPVGGEAFQHSGFGNTQQFSMLLAASGDAPMRLKSSGISLKACLEELPYMGDTLQMLGGSLRLVRCTAAAHTQEGQGAVLSIVIHPQRADLVDAFGNLVKAEADAVNAIDIAEVPGGGYIIRSKNDHPARVSWPHSICLTEKEVFFTCSDHGFNEFGYLYIALHICGNFARYYPDLWLKDIEKSSALSLAIDEFCKHVTERAPLLALSELSRTYHILAS